MIVKSATHRDNKINHHWNEYLLSAGISRKWRGGNCITIAFYLYLFYLSYRSLFVMEEYEKICDVSVERMLEISAYVRDQMNKGLKGEPSDLKMLPSFVDTVCSGRGDWIE